MANSDNDATKVIFQKTGGTQETVIMPDRSRAMGSPAAASPLQGVTQFVPFGQSQGTVDPEFNPVAGWLVIVEGPGRGKFRPVFYGQNAVGRNPDMKVVLDFGDSGISRDAHAFVIYDEVDRRFFIKDNGQSNLVRHNGAVVLKPTELRDRDLLSIGQTTLMFVALCDQNFDWLGNHASAST